MTQQKKMQRRPVTHITVTATQTGVIPHDAVITDNTKHAGGRPTSYTPEVCSKVIEWGKQGYSKTEMCSELGISRNCLYEWAKAHEEFNDTLLVAIDRKSVV